MLKKRVGIFGFAAVLSAVLAGCGGEKRSFRTVDDFRPDDVMFVANGEEYLRRQFDRDVETRLALVRHRYPARLAKQEKEFTERFRQSVLNSMVEMALAAQKAKSLGLAETSADRAAAEQRYVRTFGRKGSAPEDFKQLADSLGDLRGNFLKIVGDEVLNEALVRRSVADAMTVTDAAVSNQVAIMLREDAQARATNAVIYATASNVWIRAFNGVDFAALADQYSQEPGKGPGGVVLNALKKPAECDANDFAVEKLEDGSNPVWESISKLRDGDLTPPLSTAEGLAVYKCVKYIEKSESTGAPAWILARIVFHRALLYPELTPAEVRERMELDLRQKAYARFSNGLHEGAKVEFPNGIDYLPKKLRRFYWNRMPHPPPATNATERSASPTNAAPPSAETNRLAKSPRSGR